jgi:predicted ABC-type ATPase
MSFPSPYPSLVVIGGPNGAGKTTISRPVINEVLGLAEFVNADVIAQGLSGFNPERAALQAGRIMLDRLRELAAARENFAFETTLASRTFAPWLIDLQTQGYRTHIILVWLKSPELAIRRVKRRVGQGGHFVPDDVVRRRYKRGIANFIRLYRPHADAWRIYDNSSPTQPRLVASAVKGEFERIEDPKTFALIEGIANEPSAEEENSH